MQVSVEDGEGRTGNSEQDEDKDLEEKDKSVEPDESARNYDIN